MSVRVKRHSVRQIPVKVRNIDDVDLLVLMQIHAAAQTEDKLLPKIPKVPTYAEAKDAAKKLLMDQAAKALKSISGGLIDKIPETRRTLRT